MPNTTGYLLAVGTLTITALQASDNYIVANFPTTSPIEDWNVQTTGLIEPGTRRSTNLYGMVANYGNYLLPSWDFLITKTQTNYLDTTVFGNVPSIAATIQTFDAYRNAWRVFNVIVTQPNLSTDDAIQINDYWFNLAKYRFTKSVLAAA